MANQSRLAIDNYQLLQKLFLLSDDGDRRLLAAFGLSAARFGALSHLARQGELTASDLCGLMLCDKANVTRLLDGLGRAGLVMRTQDRADGRRLRVTLTAAGRERWAAAQAALHASILERFGCLSPADQSSLNELLRRLSAALEHQLADEGIPRRDR